MHIQGQKIIALGVTFSFEFAEEKIGVCKTKAKLHFIGRDIAGLGQNTDFQPQKVGGQRIGFIHKDWKVGGQLPALPNRLRRPTRRNVNGISCQKQRPLKTIKVSPVSASSYCTENRRNYFDLKKGVSRTTVWRSAYYNIYYTILYLLDILISTPMQRIVYGWASSYS